MESHRKRDNRDLDEEEDESVNSRASDDVLKTRKIRKPNYQKGMTSSSGDVPSIGLDANKSSVFLSAELRAAPSHPESQSELNSEEPTSALCPSHQTESHVGDTMTSQKVEEVCSRKIDSDTDTSVAINSIKPCDAENPSTGIPKPCSSEIARPLASAPKSTSKQALSDEESKVSETSPAQTSTNPFANILNHSKLRLFKNSHEDNTSWNSDVSFVSTALAKQQPTPTVEAVGENESREVLEEEEFTDQSNERSVADDEVVVARCFVKSYRLDPDNKAWKELGPGILKLAVSKDLQENQDDPAREMKFGRLLFHDSRNRINRMNFSLGESLKVSDGSKGKNLIFTTAVDTAGETSSGDCQTYLVKEVAGPSVYPTSGMPEFRELIEKYSAMIAQSIESNSKEDNE